MAFNNGAPPAESPTAETETETNAAASAAAEGSTAAESSPADEKDANPVDLLSVVKSAVQPVEAPGAESSAAEGEGETQPGEAEVKPEGATEAEQAEADAKLPFHEHPRWKEVVAERNSFREDAGRFREVSSFMDTHGLSSEDVVQGFDVMAKLKSGDPKQLGEAREYFANGLAQLDGLLGNVLPEDLQTRVETGELDEEAAQELAQARATAKLTTQRLEARDTATEQQRDSEARVATANAMATAVDDWEKQQRSNDPDYAHKADLVEARCLLITTRDPSKKPTNPEMAVALAKQAYADVSASFKGAQPKLKPIKPSPVGSSAPHASAPKTLLEANRAALNR